MSSAAPSRPSVIRIDVLLDVGHMADAVASALGPTGGRVASARLVDHKPGRRALVVYGFAEGGAVYAKAYPDPSTADRSFEILRALHRSATGARVPRPLGVVPELALVLYEPVPGAPLDELAGTEAGTAGLAAAGTWLSRLHGSGAGLDRMLDPAHEAENAGAWAAEVSSRHPAVAAGATRLVTALAASVPSAPPSAVPIHKDFHYQHVIVGDAASTSVGVVDVDEARMGDPAFDVAHFCAYLHLLGLRTTHSASVVDSWLAAFLGRYGSERDWTPGATFAWYTAYTFVKIAKQLAAGSGPHPRPTGSERDAQLAAVIDEGLACLAT